MSEDLDKYLKVEKIKIDKDFIKIKDKVFCVVFRQWPG